MILGLTIKHRRVWKLFLGCHRVIIYYLAKAIKSNGEHARITQEQNIKGEPNI
jgi:hypothetical protein